MTVCLLLKAAFILGLLTYICHFPQPSSFDQGPCHTWLKHHLHQELHTLFAGSDDAASVAAAALGGSVCSQAALPQAQQTAHISALQCTVEPLERKWLVAK